MIDLRTVYRANRYSLYYTTFYKVMQYMRRSQNEKKPEGDNVALRPDCRKSLFIHCEPVTDVTRQQR